MLCARGDRTAARQGEERNTIVLKPVEAIGGKNPLTVHVWNHMDTYAPPPVHYPLTDAYLDLRGVGARVIRRIIIHYYGSHIVSNIAGIKNFDHRSSRTISAL